ncbi:hypothetical protein [Reyranella sp.]|uniref:hypothetical protein n=1 Tax=Reyranella sp. TaxID=1929291 RepID=UPI0037840ABB
MRRPDILRPLSPSLCVPIINGKVADLRMQKVNIQHAANLLCVVADQTGPLWAHVQYLAERILDHTHEMDHLLAGMTYVAGHLHPGYPRPER